jgi:RNA polymerase sigma factor (sigma-70 family)
MSRGTRGDGTSRPPASDAADRAAFTRFVATHRADLVRTATAMTGRPGHDAEDLVQSALVRLAPVWSTVESPLAYTRQIMSRLAIDAARVRQRRPEALGLGHDDLSRITDRASPDATERTVLADQLWRGLATLSPRQRHVLALRFLADCTEAETARILDCPAGTVKSEAHRGLKRLRAALHTDAWDSDARDTEALDSTGGRQHGHG